MTATADHGGAGAGPMTGWSASRQRGSVLLLMPAAVLIVVILGGLATDQAVVFGAQRDLVALAQVAANDAAAAGVDVDALHDEGTLGYDARRIDEAVRAAVQVGDVAVRSSWTVADGTIVVRLTRPVELVFAKGIAGMDDVTSVGATAEARLLID